METVNKPKLVVLTGAGISAESGISTFRSQNGLWEEKKVEDLAYLSAWQDKKKRQGMLDFYNARFAQLNTVEPNIAHLKLKELEELFDVTIITQNVDDLHERAGSTNIIHLHGELNKMCSSNDKTKTLSYSEIKIGDKHPDGSQLRPFIVWFGEDVPKMYDAAEAISKAEVVIVIGTSLEVYPAASLLQYAARSEDIYLVDPNPTNIDNIRDYIKLIEKPATEGMTELVDILKIN